MCPYFAVQSLTECDADEYTCVVSISSTSVVIVRVVVIVVALPSSSANSVTWVLVPRLFALFDILVAASPFDKVALSSFGRASFLLPTVSWSDCVGHDISTAPCFELVSRNFT